MRYVRRPPRLPLDTIVDHYWAFEGYEVPVATGLLFADGCCDLMFALDISMTLTRGQRTQSWRGAAISGQRTAPIRIDLPAKRFTIVGARLRPWGLPPLIGAPAIEARDAVIDLHAFWSADAERIADRMAAAETPAARIDILEDLLERRFDARRLPSTGLIEKIDDLGSALCAHPIARAARELKVSERQLGRLFQRHVGLAPKTFQRVSRFRRLVRTMQTMGELAWTRAAYHCGFADQPHLCREFRAFAGITPSQYIPAAAPDYMPWAPRQGEDHARRRDPERSSGAARSGERLRVS